MMKGVALIVKKCRLLNCWILLAAGIIFLFPACGGMRNLAKNREDIRLRSDSTVQLRQVELVEQKQVVESLILNNDSLNSSYRVQIWPTGRFSYNAASGFEGTAEKILITGSSKQGKQSLSSRTVKNSREQVMNKSLDLQKQSTAVKHTAALKKLVSWKTVLGYALMVFCLLASLLIFRLIRKQFSF